VQYGSSGCLGPAGHGGAAPAFEQDHHAVDFGLLLPPHGRDLAVDAVFLKEELGHRPGIALALTEVSVVLVRLVVCQAAWAEQRSSDCLLEARVEHHYGLRPAERVLLASQLEVRLGQQ
jgi:hypothetical protein